VAVPSGYRSQRNGQHIPYKFNENETEKSLENKYSIFQDTGKKHLQVAENIKSAW